MIATSNGTQLTPSAIVSPDDEAAHNRPNHLISSHPRAPRRAGGSIANASFANKALTSIALVLAFGPTGAEARTGVEIAEM